MSTNPKLEQVITRQILTGILLIFVSGFVPFNVVAKAAGHTSAMAKADKKYQYKKRKKKRSRHRRKKNARQHSHHLRNPGLAKINSVYPQSCVQGGTVIIQGKNLGTHHGQTLLATSGRKRIKLSVKYWSNSRIVAVVPKNSQLSAGQSFSVGIQNQKHRFTSNTNAGFSICGSSGGSDDPRIARTPPQGAGGIPDLDYVPGQIVVMSSNLKSAKRTRIALARLGFRLHTQRSFRSLGLAMTVFIVPRGMAVPEAIQRARKRFPRLTVDANSLYGLHQGFKLPRALRDTRQKQMIKWGVVPRHCGRGLRFGLLDTGIEKTHKAFRGRRIISKNFVTGRFEVAPKTHATGIASIWLSNRTGLAPSANVYVAGVFKRDQKRQVKTTTAWLVNGLNWLVSQRVDVINMSFGGPQNSVFKQALNRAQAKGLILVASAGNNGPSAPPVYPAAYNNTVAVTAVDKRFKIYSRANHGSYIDFAAPGVNISVAKPGNGRKFVSGTSYAAPYVAAAIGMLKFKQLSGYRAKVGYLQRNSVDLGTRGKDHAFGWGLIQVRNACR